MKPISSNVAGAITTLTKNDSKAAIIALESVVVAGRTLQAYKRGKADEARERFLEETTGSLVWLFGVVSLNELGDRLLGKILKKPGANFDVGTDKILRRPFDNFMQKVAPKGFSGTQIALLKGAKVLSSILLANLFIGFVMPKVNHYITNTVNNNKKDLEAEQKQANITTTEENTEKNLQNTAFKGALGALNTFTNAIENTNTGKLLSTDFGIAGGRMYNARSKEERREIAIRDLGSIYFYMWAQGHVGNVMNLIETGKSTRLNPTTTNEVTKYLEEFLNKNGGEMSVEEFRNAILGKKDSKVKIPENIPFETQELSNFAKFRKVKPLEVAKVSDVLKEYKDPAIIDRIKAMSKLQPERLEEAVITKQQLIDALNNAEITNPTLLDEAYNTFTKGAYKDEFKYVSNSSLEKLKSEMIDYAESICKDAKGGKVNAELLKKAKNKNLIYNGINFAAGFTVAAAFLSTLIPKFQYYVTRKTTGVDAFPGTYDYEHHKDMRA